MGLTFWLKFFQENTLWKKSHFDETEKQMKQEAHRLN